MRNAGANSSKVGIPWKIRWDKIQKPLLINQEGVFFILRKGVEKMDMEKSMHKEEMGMGSLVNFKKSILLKARSNRVCSSFAPGA